MLFIDREETKDPERLLLDDMDLGETFLWDDQVHMKIGEVEFFNLETNERLIVGSGHVGCLVRVKASYVKLFQD